MRRFVKKWGTCLRGRGAGFTLVELLVVVGIIVALAAAVVPNVSKFTGKGAEGAKATEIDSVQSAMDSMMADSGITTVTALIAPASATNAWAALPGGTGAVPLSGYLRADPTTYYYCFDGTGKITKQDTTSTTCP